MLRINKGIKTRLIVSLVVTTLVVLVLFFILLNSYLKDYSWEESEKTILFLGENASSLLQKALFNQDYNQLSSIARSIILEDFDYLIIYDNVTGNIAFIQDTQDIEQEFDPDKTFKNKSSFEKATLHIRGEEYTQYLFPVISQGITKPLGFLVIGVSRGTIQSKLLPITQRLWVVSLLIFLTLTVIIYFLSDKIVKPIRDLSAKIGAFASGDYAVRSDIKTKDEIGRLSESFNKMADKINEQILSIEKYSKNLEKMVEERTEELLRALDDIKEKDKKLSQAEKISSLNSVVSSIAHEINNPLAIISGNVQMIDARTSEEGLKKKLSTAQDAIQRIATLIDEINFFSAIKDLILEPLGFSILLSNALSKVVPEEVNIEINGEENDRITSNQNLLTICLENILQNSIDQFRHKGIKGHIRINYVKEPYYFVIEFIDNGGGIKNPKRVFEPFYTTFNEKKGLGLTFVFHAVQAMNGEITIENIQDGAKVTLKIPAAEETD